MRNKNLLIVTLVLGLIAFAAVRLTREAPKTEAGKQPLVAAALLPACATQEPAPTAPARIRTPT